MQARWSGRWFRRVFPLPALLAALLAGVPQLGAQEEPEEDSGASWRTSYFPYLSGKANDGPVVSARIRYWQPAEYEARTTYTAALDGATGVELPGHPLRRGPVPGARPVEGLAARRVRGRRAAGPLRLLRAGQRYRARSRPGGRRDAVPLPGAPHPLRRHGRGHPADPWSVPGGAPGRPGRGPVHHPAGPVALPQRLRGGQG